MNETDETHTRWCTKQLLMDEINEGLPIPDEVQNNCWWMRQIMESIPDGVRNNCWWMRPVKDYPYQMRYKTTVDGWERWWNPRRMVYDTTVDGWNQTRTTHSRWNTKQLLMGETGEGIHTRWCTKQLLMDETSAELHIPDKEQNNCWWMRQMKPIPDGVRNNCWWMRPMNDYPYQMKYKTTVDGWDR